MNNTIGLVGGGSLQHSVNEAGLFENAFLFENLQDRDK